MEFRGAWVATVTNIDWPSQPGLPVSEQLQQLHDYVDLLSQTNFNAVFLQVRPVCDAFYDSDLEPWSVYLTGEQGLAPDPFYDPLAEWVSYAHSRDIQVHAWLNPYRANLVPSWDGLTQDHIANRLRQYAYPYGGQLWMDPASREVEDHTVEVIMDVVTRYRLYLRRLGTY